MVPLIYKVRNFSAHFGFVIKAALTVLHFSTQIGPRIEPETRRIQGFIAQDLYKVYPEAVTVGGDDAKKSPWSVDYGRLSPLLVKAVQELKSLFDGDHDEIAKLKTAMWPQSISPLTVWISLQGMNKFLWCKWKK